MYEEIKWNYSCEIKAVVKKDNKRAFVFLSTGQVLHLNLETLKVDKICATKLGKGCEAGLKITSKLIYVIGSFGCG